MSCAAADRRRVMIERLKPVSTAPLPCKICGSAAALYGVVDFHKTCHEEQGSRLPLSGVPIYFRRCATCGFLFTDAFDDWTDEQFKRHIYDDGYLAVDPGYQDSRPRSNADMVIRLWGQHKANLRVLDYGGGNDVLCTALRAHGFPVAVTHDPMVPEHAHRPVGTFDLVTCFETLEHMPDPAAGIGRILEHLAEPGLVLFSTLVQPADFDNYGVKWWYIAPRNGHISIFSRKALAMAWGRRGYKTASFNDGLHLAYRTLPPFAAHLVK
jgi:SAM-dependent methyltransferase